MANANKDGCSRHVPNQTRHSSSSLLLLFFLEDNPANFHGIFNQSASQRETEKRCAKEIWNPSLWTAFHPGSFLDGLGARKWPPDAEIEINVGIEQNQSATCLGTLVVGMPWYGSKQERWSTASL